MKKITDFPTSHHAIIALMDAGLPLDEAERFVNNYTSDPAYLVRQHRREINEHLRMAAALEAIVAAAQHAFELDDSDILV